MIQNKKFKLPKRFQNENIIVKKSLIKGAWTRFINSVTTKKHDKNVEFYLFGSEGKKKNEN
jgi:hypothetical protein